MKSIRSAFGPLFAVLLLLQWAVGPARCLGMVAAVDDGICRAVPAPDHGGDFDAGMGSECPACHLLDVSILPPPAELPRVAIVLVLVDLSWGRAAGLVLAGQRSAQQPRAPPGLS